MVGNENSTTSKEKQQSLWNLTETNCNGLTEQQTKQLYEFMLSYADVFACNDSKVSRTNKIQHTIHPDAPAIQQVVYWIPPVKNRKNRSHFQRC